ncbi:MAG: hypothetical protein AAGI91_15330 [Bacteroidota bacterium]
MTQSFENPAVKAPSERAERSPVYRWAVALRSPASREAARDAADRLLAALRDPDLGTTDRALAENALTAWLDPLVGHTLWTSERAAETDPSSEVVGALREEIALAIADAVRDGEAAGSLRAQVRTRLRRAASRQEAQDTRTGLGRDTLAELRRRRDRLERTLGRVPTVDDMEWALARDADGALAPVRAESARLAFATGHDALDGEGRAAEASASRDDRAWLVASTDATDEPLLAAEQRSAAEVIEAAAAGDRDTTLRQALLRVLCDRDWVGLGLSKPALRAFLLLEDPLLQPAYGVHQGEPARTWDAWHALLGLPPSLPATWAGVRALFEGRTLTDDALRKAADRGGIDGVPRTRPALAAWRAARALLLALVVGLGASAPEAQTAPFVEAHVRANRAQSNAALVASFDYAGYLRHVAYTDLARVQRDRRTLWRLRDRGDDVGDRWVYALAEAFARHYPLSHAGLAANVAIGEAYLRGRPTGTVHGDAVYRVVGYYHLGRVARYMEAEAEAGRLDLDDHEPLVDRLAANDVYIERPESSWDKLWRNLRAGRVGYLWKRLWGTAAGGAGRTRYTLRDAGRYAGGRVHAFSLWDGTARAGHAVWLDRPALQAHYVARSGRHPTVAARATADAQTAGRRPAVALAGGFTNAAGQPEGLTVDRGEVVNAILEPERHALVIVERGGGVRVVDLGGGVVRVQDGRRALVLRPFASLVDYGALLSWARRHRVTLFQTQLLAFGGRLRIDPAKAPREARERRLLALVRTPRGAVQHVVLDLTRPTALADAAADAKDLLEARDLRVETLLNLDVGSYNVFQLWDDQGRPHSDVHGPTPLNRATNLLLYTR